MVTPNQTNERTTGWSLILQACSWPVRRQSFAITNLHQSIILSHIGYCWYLKLSIISITLILCAVSQIGCVMYCSSQPSIVHWLSSSIFPCSVVCPAMVTSDQNSTSTSPRPPNPYIFWKLMIIAIQKYIRNTNTKTKTNTKTMTKTKTPRE